LASVNFSVEMRQCHVLLLQFDQFKTMETEYFSGKMISSIQRKKPQFCFKMAARQVAVRNEIPAMHTLFRVCRDIDCTLRAKEECVGLPCSCPGRFLLGHVCLRVCALRIQWPFLPPALLWAVTRHVPASIALSALYIRGQEIGILKTGLYDYWRAPYGEEQFIAHLARNLIKIHIITV
jgi:hypothetical protein